MGQIYTLQSFESNGLFGPSAPNPIVSIPAATPGRQRGFVFMYAHSRQSDLIQMYLGGITPTATKKGYCDNGTSSHMSFICLWDEAAIVAAGSNPQVTYSFSAGEANNAWCYGTFEAENGIELVDTDEYIYVGNDSLLSNQLTNLDATGEELALAAAAYGNGRTHTYSTGWTKVGQVLFENNWTNSFGYATDVSAVDADLTLSLNNTCFDKCLVAALLKEKFVPVVGPSVSYRVRME